MIDEVEMERQEMLVATLCELSAEHDVKRM
jgi:hypothetical protein